MGARSQHQGLFRFARYDRPSDFKQQHAMALASLLRPPEMYVLGIDCADRWLFKKWNTKLVLTDERVLAFSPDPVVPVKRTHWLADIADVQFDTGLFTAELRLRGIDFYETYPVPKGLGREFAEAVRVRLD